MKTCLLVSCLGLWLASRITRPLQSLREQVLERTRPPVSTRPVEAVGDRDFAELGDAFNELLGALDERRRAMEEAGTPVIDLGMGDPCEPLPDFVKQTVGVHTGRPSPDR